jgi:hypothetical protein
VDNITFTKACAFQEADDAWHAALVAKYGDNAGSMRYLVQGQGEENSAIRKAYVARLDAMRAYEAAQQP